MVIESTMEPLSRAITEALGILTIGIGASPQCDGQILVAEDMLGLFPDFTPRFVRKFANLGQEVDRAVADYAHAVRTRTFPGPAECVGMPKAD